MKKVVTIMALVLLSGAAAYAEEGKNSLGYSEKDYGPLDQKTHTRTGPENCNKPIIPGGSRYCASQHQDLNKIKSIGDLEDKGIE